MGIKKKINLPLNIALQNSFIVYETQFSVFQNKSLQEKVETILSQKVLLDRKCSELESQVNIDSQSK